jgi:ATP-binding cassette, subfamily B, multidrug efflux pump
VFLVVIGPRLLGEATNIIVDGFHRPDGIDFAALHRQLLIFVAGRLPGVVGLSYTQAYVLAGVVQRSMFALRESVERKLNHLPLSYIDRQPRGDLLSRVTNDIDNLSQSLQQTISQILTSLLTLLGVAIMMFTISPLLAVMALVTVPVSVWLMKLIGGKARPRFMAQWRHTGDLNAQAEEVFTGHAIVKSFGRQREAEERFRSDNDQLYEASFSAQFMANLIQPAMPVHGQRPVHPDRRRRRSADLVGVAEHRRDAGDDPVRPPVLPAAHAPGVDGGHVPVGHRVARAGARAARRRGAVTRAGADRRPAAGAGPGGVRGRALLLRPRQAVDHRVERGGRAGPDRGDRRPDRCRQDDAGQPDHALLRPRRRSHHARRARHRRRFPRNELRAEIGMVLQDTWLFGGTIRENLRYGNPDATDEQIVEAARVTYVDRFVHSLPDGYDTMINDEGDNISTGEKQLMTIARAFLDDPSILILDEATSSVDTRTEVLIQEAMNNLRQNRTSFVIAHRLSTIRGADVILVMEDGRIVEQGDHDSLLEAHGAYWRLYNAQFAGTAT